MDGLKVGVGLTGAGANAVEDTGDIGMREEKEQEEEIKQRPFLTGLADSCHARG